MTKNAKSAVAAAATVARVRNDEVAFTKCYIKHKGNLKAIAEELGMAVGSVTVRKSNMKKAGKMLPQFPRAGGGGARVQSVEEFNALLATLTAPSDSDAEAANKEVAPTA
jgi:hypothetical protein